MKPRMKGLLLALGTLLLLAAVAGAQAGSSPAYDLSWWTVDGGGETLSTGPGYSLGGTAGQPDAGPVMSGGDYQLTGGFWPGGAGVYRVYLPVVLRGY
jgi:hypothetical protein